MIATKVIRLLLAAVFYTSNGIAHSHWNSAAATTRIHNIYSHTKIQRYAPPPTILWNVRGGSLTPGLDDDDVEWDEGSSDDEREGDVYDDDDFEGIDEDEGAAMHQHRRHQQQQSSSSSSRPPRPDENPDPFTRKAPYLPLNKKKKPKNALSRMATTSLSLTKKAATSTVKTSGKAAFYLMRPKSIQEHELWGVWRLDQQVGMKQCTANIELTRRGEVIVRSGGDGDGDPNQNKIVWKARYRFVQPTWPQSCRIDFEAPAFQPNKSKKPWMLRYKGTIERKMADKTVLKIVGTLYDIERPKSMFGKELPTRYNKIGSFVGRRRVVLLEEEEDEEEECSDMEQEEDVYDPEEEADPEEDDPYDAETYHGESGDGDDYDDQRI